MLIVRGGPLPGIEQIAFNLPPENSEDENHLARLACWQATQCWLDAHYDELLARAPGKYVAVVGEDSRVVDSLDAGSAWAQQSHPGEPMLVQRLIPR